MTYRTQHLDKTTLLNWVNFLFYKLSAITYELFLQNKVTRRVIPDSDPGPRATMLDYQNYETNPNPTLVSGHLPLDYLQNEPKLCPFQSKIKEYLKNKPIFYTLICVICEICGFDFTKRTQTKQLFVSLDFIWRLYIILAVYIQQKQIY
jgi:hypothetical protein